MKNFVLLSIILVFLNLFQIINTQRSQGAGYGFFDTRSAKHGTEEGNGRFGGTCKEFLELNSLQQCCNNREDDCYMIHYDTRCYCDLFCDRPRSDCCPDAGRVCAGGEVVPQRPPPPPIIPEPEPETEPPTPEPTEPVPIPGDLAACEHEGQTYEEGEEAQINCQKCKCVNNQWFCDSTKKCLIDVNLMSKINSAGKTWKASNYSKFWGKELRYGYERRLGTRLPSQKQKSFDPSQYYSINDLVRELPTNYNFYKDSSVANSLRRNPIRDQGDCAASWAFSTVDVATDRLVKLSKGKAGNQTEYSVQNLISCAILKNDQDGCSPSSTDVAWNYINHLTPDSGLVDERCNSYKNGDRTTAHACQIPAKKTDKFTCPDDDQKYDRSILLATPAYPLKVTKDEDIMREILIQGPVQAVFKVYRDFFMYKEGIYEWSRVAPEADVTDPYHSVKILGWGTENGVDYWLCANSWGSDWGENGYFRIKRGDCEIDKHIYAAWGQTKINGKLLYSVNALNQLVKSMYSSSF